MNSKTFLGLLGALGIWLTAGLALPFVNILNAFSPEQLMVFRGFLTALMALIALRGIIGKVDTYTWLIALILPFATLGLFRGIRHWGAGPTIIIMTATPLVNLAISVILGRNISRASVIGFVLLLGGVLLTHRGGHFHWVGFAWSVFATVMNGILYECFARAKASSLQKCFYACTGMGILGLVLSVNTPWPSLTDPKLTLMLIGFAFIGGFLYWIANMLAFENLPTTEASVLAQVETPAVLIGAYLMLGEQLTFIQWTGVWISLFGAWYLGQWLAQKNLHPQPRTFMSRKIIAVVLLISLLVKTEWISSPATMLWGNPEFITYDATTETWTNNNPSIEYWRHQGDAELVKKLTAPEKVPTRKDSQLTFSKDVFCPPCMRISVPKRGTISQYGVRPSRRFILINVEETLLDLTNDNDRQYRVWPHLGILFVGTAAHEEGYEVVLWDELVQGQVPLEKLVKPGDIVGFSLVVTGIERGMKLAAEAKELGARYCIAGNDSAIFRSKNILSRPDKPIDAVFTGNSVDAVKSFFRNIDTVGIQHIKIPGVETTPNHQQRSNEYVALLQEQQERKTNPDFRKDDVFIVPKLDLFGREYWDEIWTNYRSQFGHKHANPDTVRNALAFFAQGCTRTRGTDVCSYCTIAGVGDFRIASDEYFIQTKQAYDACGIDMIFCVTDSLYEMVPVLEKFKRFMMKWNAMTIYGRAQGIVRNPHLLDQWMSVVNDRLLLNVGMDSGDNKLLHEGVVKSSITQGSRLSENHEAVKLIKASGAHLHYSLIFGIPGETLDSCNRSIEFLEWTIQTLGHQLDIAETDKYWLNYGSPASAIFHSYEHAVHLAGIAGKTISKSDWQKHFASHADELVVPMHVEAAWYRFFTNIDMDTADEFNNRAAAIMARHTGSIRGRAFKPTA